MVTSSAVVGSSAISSLGLHASPMAIMTRWRMPPESWCGYWASRLSGSVMPTSVSSSMARSRAAFSSMFRWMVSGSMICSPILSTGLREVMGSWKIMAISRPRMRRISSSESFSSSLPPSNLIRPEGMRAVPGGSRRITASAETDLPEPEFTDDGHHLARMDRIAQALNGPDRAMAGHEMYVQIVDLEHGRQHTAGHSRRCRFCKRLIAEARDDLVIHSSEPP